ncbi:MAG: hypothetical protein EAX95_13070 [Candidatus Thorarchaeota archaeon]|nr:hypothetical protein [Candidatus Thorarchaeota archaeon]
METELTEEMKHLLVLIDEYTENGPTDELVWIKELPLMAIVYQGIVENLFPDYDYAPWSVPMLDGSRQLLNISREGKDDLEDLLNLRLLSILRLSTSKFGYLTAFRLTGLGKETVNSLPQSYRTAVSKTVEDECGVPRPVIIRNRAFFFICPTCKKEVRIDIDDIEDVSYEVKRYLPDYLNLRISEHGEDFH